MCLSFRVFLKFFSPKKTKREAKFQNFASRSFIKLQNPAPGAMAQNLNIIIKPLADFAQNNSFGIYFCRAFGSEFFEFLNVQLFVGNSFFKPEFGR